MRTVAWVALLAGGVGVTAGQAAAQSGPETLVGTWLGALAVQGIELRIVFHLELDEAGGLTGTMDSPDQGATGIPISGVELDGHDVTIGVAAVGGTYAATLSESGDEMTGTWSQGPAALELAVTKSDGPAEAPHRPQTPEPPYPYASSDVRFGNEAAGIELAGTLTVPAGDGPFPGVVLVSGSGPQDRDESLLGHKPFLVLADHLTRRGVAVLRFDDRGVGASGGDFSSATSEDFTADALAAVSFLRHHERVDGARVGVAGHSEGGLVAPMAAVRSPDVAFVVMLAGPGVPGIDVLVAQGELINRASGTPEEVVRLNTRIQSALAAVLAEEPDSAAAAPLLRAAMQREIATLSPESRAAAGEQLGEAAIERTVAQLNTPWFRFFLHHDPRPVLERVRVPVLAVIGEKDLQVPHAQSEPEIRAALERGGNRDATVLVLPGLNHLFQEAATGVPAEYQRIEQTMSPLLLDTVGDWILERFAR